jgi:hypothetical protein
MERRYLVKRLPRLVIALAVLLSGLALVPYVGLPAAAFNWQRYAGAYPYQPPTLEIDHDSGKPGSFLNVTGHHYPANSTATIQINNHTLGTVPTDALGDFSFQMNTGGADEGAYYVTVTVNPSATIRFTLDQNAPLYPQSGSGPAITVPAGIAFTRFVYLPIVFRQ